MFIVALNYLEFAEKIYGGNLIKVFLVFFKDCCE